MFPYDWLNDFSSQSYKGPVMPNHKIKSFQMTIEGGPTLELSNVDLGKLINEIVSFAIKTPHIPDPDQAEKDMDILSNIPTIFEQNVNTGRRIKPTD